MRLDFNVLWVDDQPDRVEAQISAIKKRMVEEGFHFAPKLCRSIEEVREVISEDIFTDEIDLILVDWDLGNGVVGEDVIAEIRQTVQYKDVVFYSAQTAPKELRRVAYEKELEGIYCANREDLVDEVVGVFESLVKKILDLDHTRGIVMGATSDIDYLVNQCLVFMDRQLDVEGKNKMLNIAMKYIKKRVDDSSNTVAKLENATTLGEFFDAHMILTSNDRLRMLSTWLKDPRFSFPREYRQAVVTYQQVVLRDRNRLGHMVLVPKGKPETNTAEGSNLVSREETRVLRCLILDLRNQFRQLFDALQSMGSSSGPVTLPDTK